MPRARVRKTCTECSLRRQQCDRQVPCGRCVKRGVPDRCRLTWPDGGYDAAIHRVYPSRRQRRTTSIDSARHANSNDAVVESDEGDSDSDSGLLSRITPNRARASIQFPSESQIAINSTAAKPRYVFKPFESINLRQSDPASSGAGRVTSWPSPTARVHDRNANQFESSLQDLLPNIELIWKLVDYHEQYLLWYHCCYHGPSFRAELQHVIATQDHQTSLSVSGLHLQWTALLFSIMAGSLTCSAEWRLRDWGISKSEAIGLSTQWYQTTISTLHHGNWTSDHCVYSVQAITTLTMSAHPLGRSAELAVLLGAALKVAQALGLGSLEYKPTAEHIDEGSTDHQRQQVLNRDIGRKLWSQLCVQDWMSVPFLGHHSINPSHFTSAAPASRSHITMEPIPVTFPTYVSYGNYLFEIAKLLVCHHEATLNAVTPFTRYQQVLDFDAKMRELATKGMPRYFHVVEPVDVEWPEWVFWARSSLTVSFAHKIIMIHRDYIRQSFVNSQYAFTRMTVVAAAKTILNESNKAKTMHGPIIWIDKAFCIAAAIVLCLDISHRPESDPERAVHRDLVTECIEQLSSFDSSVFAVRGAALLRTILRDPQERTAAGVMVDLMSETGIASISAGLRTKGNDELFPPPTGFCNEFLLQNLLVLDVVEEG